MVALLETIHVPTTPKSRRTAFARKPNVNYIRYCEYTKSVSGRMMLDSMRRFKAGVFQAMAHPTRVGIVEQLRLGEMSVGRLCEKLGIEQANASQHLAILRSKHLVETRKEGNQIFYRLRDPLLGDVLESLKRFFFAHMQEALAMLKQEEQREAGRRKQSGKKART
jgi:DNA-binding transcriptional ArsR family regulator